MTTGPTEGSKCQNCPTVSTRSVVGSVRSVARQYWAVLVPALPLPTIYVGSEGSRWAEVFRMDTMTTDNNKTNAALASRRWQQLRAERDDLPLFDEQMSTNRTGVVRRRAQDVGSNTGGETGNFEQATTRLVRRKR